MDRKKVWIERKQPFSQSLLWDLQQHYFRMKGIEAWRRNEVPHYITNNAAIANSYAETVFAFWADRQRMNADDPANGEPLYICELGAGTGRFAHYFLNRLQLLCSQSGVPLDSFRYVLTDFSRRNLEFWRDHPRFQPFVEQGALDMALFDVRKSDTLRLQFGGRTIVPGSLARPLVVIANYVWDSVRQDLYRLNQGKWSECLLSLALNEIPEQFDAGQILRKLKHRYDYGDPIQEPAYAEPDFLAMMDDYRRSLAENTHLLFPAEALRCLQRLNALSRRGLMLISGDKGHHRLADIQGNPPPAIVRHGSFSLNVNFHAFQAYCERIGGAALCPDRQPAGIHVSAFLMLPQACEHRETIDAYRRHISDFGPDDFRSIVKQLHSQTAEKSAEEILDFVHWSAYDSPAFSRFLPRLTELAPTFGPVLRQRVLDAIEQVWKLYYPIGEKLDLAYAIAGLLYAMDEYEMALIYFEHSVRLYGKHTETMYNMAACCKMLGRRGQARGHLKEALELDPSNAYAMRMLAEWG